MKRFCPSCWPGLDCSEAKDTIWILIADTGVRTHPLLGWSICLWLCSHQCKPLLETSQFPLRGFGNEAAEATYLLHPDSIIQASILIGGGCGKARLLLSEDFCPPIKLLLGRWTGTSWSVQDMNWNSRFGHRNPSKARWCMCAHRIFRMHEVIAN